MTTATEILRQALRARKMNLAMRATEMGIPSNMLEDFMAGRNSLTAQHLCALAMDLFGGHAIYVPELDLCLS